MPYTSIDQLPDPVRNSLPQPAQRIFMKAFNSAYDSLETADEVPAFKIAWSAVKRRYHKVEGRWVKKESQKRRTH